ncbi:MAG TPA: diguanylate cyclase [Ramlibacter sp.]|nr:diguanylate cyclase [Ramlibacter sp.]
MNKPSDTTAPATRRDHGHAPAGGEASHGRISHTLRDLERWVAWSIAAYTAWLGLFAYPGVPEIWFFVLYAGLVGKWAEISPPRSQGEMALRGMALIAGAYMLHTHTAEVGGAGGPFFFWLSMTCVAYAFMLRPAWGAAVVAVAALEFTVASALAGPPGVSGPAVVQNGVLHLFPLLLAMKFGAVMRRPDDMLESGRIDAATSLYNQAGLVAHGDDLLAAMRRERRPVSVAVFDCADLLEVRSIYGSRIARQLTARVVSKFESIAGGAGLAARTGPAEFTLVLPGLGRDKAMAAIQRALGRPGRVEFDAGDSEIVLVPGMAVQAVGPESASIEDVHLALRQELARREEEEQRRQNYLQRERTRHSRPMGMVSLPERSGPHARAARVQLSKTLPAPLAAN